MLRASGAPRRLAVRIMVIGEPARGGTLKTFRIVRVVPFAAALAAVFAAQLPAQDTTELLNRMKAMEERIKALEAEVQTLKGQPAIAPAVPPAAPVPVGAPQALAPQPEAQTAPALGG